MRKLSFRATALILSLILTLGPAASASWAMGSKTHEGTTHLAEGVDYTRQYLWSSTYSDLRTERYLEYTPNSVVQPTVAYGKYLLSTSTLSAMADALETNGKRVIGGINGDYFVLATGEPLGMVVTDGILRSSSSYHHALGFDAEGNAFIGKPELSITVTLNGQTFPVGGGLNKIRSETGGYVLYTSDFAATTKHTSPGIDIILVPNTDKLGQPVEAEPEIEIVADFTEEEVTPPPAESPAPTDTSEQASEETESPLPEPSSEPSAEPSDEPSDEPSGEPTGEPPEEAPDPLIYTDVPVIGGRISCTVEKVLHSQHSIAVPKGKLVLSVHGKGPQWLIDQLASLQAGDTVDIDISSPDKRWNTAATAVGGLYKMITNGQVEEGLVDGQGPRTAVGIRADGTVVFYTVDGRQSGYSVGASMTQVAKRLVELGCVEAVCMDGGGSTTLGATLPGQSGFSVLSSPSDGVERSVSNAIFLVAQRTDPGTAQQLSLSPGDAILFPGSKLRLSAMATDALGQTVTRYTNNLVTYTVPTEGGTVSNGVLTAGSEPGSYTLEASVDGLTGTSRITIIPTPDRLSLRNAQTDATVTALNVAPGQQIRLLVDAVYRNLPMDCQNADFTWGISGSIGTIDRFGNYTAGNHNGEGTITVSAGARTLTIPVTVTGTIRTLQDFEGDFLDMGGSLTAQIEPENRAAYIRFGRQSAKLTYNLAESPFAAVSISLEAAQLERYLSLWVCGDGSGNTLTAPFLQSNGTQSELTLAVLDFTGWKQVTVRLPAGGGQILALQINSTGTAPFGTIWLDQVVISDLISPDHVAPEISLSLSLAGSTLLADLSDDLDAGFSDQQITATYDGIKLDFELDGTHLSAPLPESDGFAHRVTLAVTDSSGNISRASLDVAPTAQQDPPFADMDGHWASPHVVYLYNQGIINGVVEGETVLFLPNNAITRGEFAVMTARWLRLDLSAYEEIVLPFVDADDIPSWALSSVKAMYALGYMQGSAGSDGLYALARTGITRAEAVTLLSRTQVKGYAPADLSFDDTDSIPMWALESVSALVAQGAVGGNNNHFYPQNTITRAEVAKLLSTLW